MVRSKFGSTSDENSEPRSGRRAVVVLPVLLLSLFLSEGNAMGGEPPETSPAQSTGAPGGPASRVWRPEPMRIGDGYLHMALYYGPWQCSQKLMTSCKQKYGVQAKSLKGCIWLADMKYDWVGHVSASPIMAGTRYAFSHCCCDYPELSVAENESKRKVWDSVRERLRNDWGSRFAKPDAKGKSNPWGWPTNDKGNPWPGHHIHDLKHGGATADLDNLLPVPPDTHILFNRENPLCYQGTQWSAVGPDLPYAN